MRSRRARIATFCVTAFVLTHAVTTAYRLRGGSWNSLDTFVVANGIMLIPGLTALVFTRWIFREPVRAALGLRFRPNRWWLVAWLLPPLLMLLTLGASLLVPGTAYDPTMSGLAGRLGFSAADGARTTGWGSLSSIAVLAVCNALLARLDVRRALMENRMGGGMKAILIVGLGLSVGVASLVGCAHGPAAPQVTVMMTGPVHRSLPENCPLTFINNQHIDILASGYEQLGMVAFAGTSDQMTAAASKMPGAVAAAACKMGGTSVSLANAIATQSTGLLQFSVWRAPAGATQPNPPTSGPPAQGI